MVINFLQQRNPPVLPCLQQMKPDHLKEEEGNELPVIEELGFNCYYYTAVEQLYGYSKANTESIGKLFVEFFNVYGNQFQYRTDVISIRTGKWITKAEKNWQKKTAVREYHFF